MSDPIRTQQTYQAKELARELSQNKQLLKDLLAAIVDFNCKHDTNLILNRIAEMEQNIMAAIDDLTTQVASNRTVIESAVVLINGIAARITAAGVDPAKLAALTADLKAKDDELAAAVVANTPAAPPAPPTP